MNRETVARIIDEIDHPDSLIRREFMDELVSLGEDGVETICANLPFANQKAQLSLIQVLREIDSAKAVVPLMRYVFDSRSDPTKADVRGLSMRAIVDLGVDAQAQKLFDFALDLLDDTDAFVRAGACELLGKFGDARARGILNDRLKDDEVVSEAAKKALLRLEVQQQEGLESHYSDDELLKNIRRESGGEREFFVQELRQRDNAFDLATDLVTARGRGMMVGLQVLAELDDPRARLVARQVVETTSDTTQLAVALRLLAAHLDGDGDPTEVAAIRQAYYNADRFVKLAALHAASRSGDTDLLQRAVAELSKTKDVETMRLIAKSVADTLPSRARWAFPKLRSVFLSLYDVKRTPETQLVQAYLLRGLRRSVESKGIGVRDAHDVAFRALANADGHQPTAISAVELLQKTTPEPLADSQRWSPDRAILLASFLGDGEGRLDLPILELLHAGAPKGVHGLTPSLKPLAFAQSDWVVSFVIPLLGQVGSSEALDVVRDLSEDDDEAIRTAALAALRRDRNAGEFIDAEFE